MLLAILFTYCFINILIYKLDSLDIYLSFITGITISIPTVNDFFKAMLHLIEYAISYETGKIPMGASDITDVKLSKDLIDANIMLKKDGVDLEASGETKCKSNTGQSSPMPNKTNKLTLLGLPLDIRQEIADHANANLNGWRKQQISQNFHIENLQKALNIAELQMNA